MNDSQATGAGLTAAGATASKRGSYNIKVRENNYYALLTSRES